MTYAIGPGQRALEGQPSHKRRAKASASEKAAPRGRSLTTLEALGAPAMSDISREQTEGLSVRTNAATKISDGVVSGNECIASSPFLESGKLGHDVLTNPFFIDEPYTGVSRQGRRSWNLNWRKLWVFALAPLAWLAFYVIVSVVNYLWAR